MNNRLRANAGYKAIVAILLAASIVTAVVCAVGGAWMIRDEYYRFSEIDPANPKITLEEVPFEETWTARYELIYTCYWVADVLEIEPLEPGTLPDADKDWLTVLTLDDGSRLAVGIDEMQLGNTQVQLYNPDGEVIYRNVESEKDNAELWTDDKTFTSRILVGFDSDGELHTEVYTDGMTYTIEQNNGEPLPSLNVDNFDIHYIEREILIDYAKEHCQNLFVRPIGLAETTIGVSGSDHAYYYDEMSDELREWYQYYDDADYFVVSQDGEPLTVVSAHDVLYDYVINVWQGDYYNWGYDENVGEYFISVRDSETIPVVAQITVVAALVSPEEYDSNLALSKVIYEKLYPHRVTAVVLCLLSVVTAIVTFILLMCAAGWKKDSDTPQRTFIDKIPLEIYCGICVLAAVLAFAVCEEISYGGDLMGIVSVVLCAAAFTVIEILFCVSIARRIKTKTLFKNTLCFYIAKYTWRFIRALPSIWMIVLGSAVYGFVTLLCIASMEEAAIVLWAIVSLLLFAAICIFDFQLGSIIKTAGQIAGGDTEKKISTEKFIPRLKSHAENINSIGSSVSAAVDERMKSERMKTDLIANVSHDIKTPLTSVINYIDLLSRTNITDPAALEYIAVLERQSVRLKRMVEDIVEASKASSGCINASIKPVDLRELLNQATAEYADRLAAGNIMPDVTVEDGCTGVMADGRLLWRVFDNLLSNISKYSQPGTRAYIKAVRNGDNVEISFRNISAEKLDIPVDALMERFTRGDRSRHTEGSGLGLSIAQSLTELQNGQLRLSIDGDLFRAAVILPACELPQASEPVPVVCQPTYMPEPAAPTAPEAKPEDEWLELPSLGEPEEHHSDSE